VVNAKKLHSPVILVFNIVQAFTRSLFFLLGVSDSGAAVARRKTGVNARNANNFGMVPVFKNQRVIESGIFPASITPWFLKTKGLPKQGFS
jgi:hypothetical protein